MTIQHKVNQGECISSIASRYGFLPATIWNEPSQAALRKARKSPNTLYPGDKVFIPDKQIKEESGAAELRHRFRRKGVPVISRIILLGTDGTPRVNEPYVLEIDGKTRSGKTSTNGKIEERISPNARSGKLIIGSQTYKLQFGHLDPISELSGIQARLNNLGFDCGTVDGVFGPKTQSALRAFQRKHNLEEIGDPDQSTQRKLKELHGS